MGRRTFELDTTHQRYNVDLDVLYQIGNEAWILLHFRNGQWRIVGQGISGYRATAEILYAIKRRG